MPSRSAELAVEHAERPRPRVHLLLDAQDGAQVAAAHRRMRTCEVGAGRAARAAPGDASRRRPLRRVGPVDLGVGLAQVERLAAPTGCTHSSRRAWAWASCTSGARRRVGQPLLGELDAADARRRLLAVAQRAVADEQALLAGGQQLGDQVVGRADRRVARAAARRRAPAGRTRRTARRGGRRSRRRSSRPAWRTREGEQVEAGDADHRHPQGVGDGLGRWRCRPAGR